MIHRNPSPFKLRNWIQVFSWFLDFHHLKRDKSERHVCVWKIQEISDNPWHQNRAKRDFISDFTRFPIDSQSYPNSMPHFSNWHLFRHPFLHIDIQRKYIFRNDTSSIVFRNRFGSLYILLYFNVEAAKDYGIYGRFGKDNWKKCV